MRLIASEGTRSNVFRCLLRSDTQLQSKMSAGKQFEITGVAYESERIAKSVVISLGAVGNGRAADLSDEWFSSRACLLVQKTLRDVKECGVEASSTGTMTINGNQSPVLSQPLMSPRRESTTAGNPDKQSALAGDWLDGPVAVLRCCVGRKLCDLKRGVEVD